MYIVETKTVKIIITKLIKYKIDNEANPNNTNISMKNSSIKGKSMLKINKAINKELHILIPKKDISSKKMRNP